MVNKLVFIVAITTALLGGTEIGYIYSITLTETQDIPTRNDVSFLMQKPEFRNMVTEEIIQNPQYKTELVSNPQAATLLGSIQTIEMRARIHPPMPEMDQKFPQSIIEQIQDQLDNISIAYRNGDKSTAYALANVAFIDNFERIEQGIATKDENLSQNINILLRMDLRDAIRNDDPPEQIDEIIILLKNKLDNARTILTQS